MIFSLILVKRLEQHYTQTSHVSYLEFEGICIIWAWDKISMDTGSATELSLIGTSFLKPQAVSLTTTIRITGHTN